MTSKELVENVARLMCDDDPDDILCDNAGEPKERWKLELEQARAVVALVIEEAAREVDAYRVEYGGYWPALEKVAARIRALAPTEGEMG